jgi:hypothetical protein
MTVTRRSADLLPYSTFWYELATSDACELEVDGRFRPGGYQGRVMMRGTWACVPVLPHAPGILFEDVLIDPVLALRSLLETVHHRYRSSARWMTAGPLVTDMISAIETDRLWELNVALVLGVRDLLGIGTPVSVARGPQVGSDEDASIWVSRHHAFTHDSILTLMMDFADPMELVLAEHGSLAEIRA